MLCPFWGRSWAPSNTTWPRWRPTSVPSGILIPPAVWPQQTWAENWWLCPLGGRGWVLFSGWTNRRDPLNSRSRDTKTRTNIINPARSNLDIVLVVMSGHSPAAIVNGRGERDLEKCNFQNFRSPVTFTMTLDRVIRHTSCIAHRPLPTHETSLKSEKLFVDGCTDVRTDKRTYRQTDISPSNVIRSTPLEST